ncbi:MAG: HD domain-containing protein [Chitinophagaceae bacterium]
MQTNSLLSEIVTYVESLFRIYNKPYLLYHNLYHTRQVVRHAEEIASHYELENNSFFEVVAAAWFHDTGQLTGEPGGHEERGVQIMKEFLAGKNSDEKIITGISLCIMATKMTATASTLTEQIICDADTYHLGTKDFLRLDKLVWEEMEQRLNKPISNKIQRSLVFLEKHQFFTLYCRQLLSAGKDRNISQLKMFLHEDKQ